MPKLNLKRLTKNFNDLNREGKDDGISAEYVDEDISHWKIHITEFPKDSKAKSDLEILSKNQNITEVVFHMKFRNGSDGNPPYPFSPPFVWIESPRISNEGKKYNNEGVVMFNTFSVFNGVFCSEILTPKMWNPVYTPLGIIQQFISLMDIEKVGFDTILPQEKNKYYETDAKSGYAQILRCHPEWKIKKKIMIY